DGLHIELAGGSAAAVRNVPGRGIDFPDLGIPEAPKFEQPLLAPLGVGPPDLLGETAGARQFHAGRGFEVGAAMLAVAHPGARPAIAEDPIHAIVGDDLPGHSGHELEVVWTERAGGP